MRILMLLGALNGALAVACGAFGAHGLKARVAPALLDTWATAAHYHLLHALALLALGLAARLLDQPELATAGWVLLTGLVLFSGSLYLLVLTGERWLGAITPLGGVALIVGWLWAAWAVWQLA